jgi:hypothetical protein
MKIYTLFALLVIILLFTACQPETNIASITNLPPVAETPLPSTATFTMVPTATPVPPTVTPIPPTITSSPTIEPPAILSNYLTGMTILNVNTFDSMPTDLTGFHTESASISDGLLKMVGHNYQGGVDFPSYYGEGKGVMYDFMMPSQTTSAFEFETYFDNGQQWQTDGYRRFGIYITPAPQTDLWIGKKGFGNYLSGNLTIKTDVWYRLVLAVGKGGDFLCVVWDPNKPDQNRYFHQLMGEKWAGNNWHFFINGSKGNMSVDNLMEISFDSIK